MTYVSRRTRITVSPWTDECDAEYILRASRKRSDGRLKRYNSCDDPRAWINDSCIKNDYLVDLMSNGEFLGKPSFRLFGRFIPVPILFKLAQRSSMQHDATMQSDKTVQHDAMMQSDAAMQRDATIQSDEAQLHEKQGNAISFQEKEANAQYKLEYENIEYEKNALEKNLVKCTCLLNKALIKLEQIDDIVGPVNEETENSRNKEIQKAFFKSKLSCICSQNQSSSARSSSYNFSENLQFSKANLKMQKAKRTVLLRKISNLRKKLKKICRQEVIYQIRSPQQKAEERSSHFQMTEQCSCSEQAQIKQLEKNKEKLKIEKEKLVTEMCQTFTALNAIKKSSQSYLNSRKRNSIPNGNCNDFQNKELQEFGDCRCGCKGSDEFSDSEKLECFESFSAEGDLNRKFDELGQTDQDFCSDYQTSSTDFPFRSSLDCRDLDLSKNFHKEEKCSKGNLNSITNTEDLGTNSNFSKPTDAAVYNNSKHYQQSASSPQKKRENSKEKKETLKNIKKSKIKFVCEESPCKKNIYADDLSAYENSSSKQMIILKAVKDAQTFRPSTTPTTKREKLECRNFAVEQNTIPFRNISERRVKSEATMKEIEKTLRNYEQRLHEVESLECRIEQLKEKSSEVCQLRKKLKKVKENAKNQRAADRENSNRERTRLCSENWELKKIIQRLKKRSIAQNYDIQNLNCIIMKFGCEIEDLKKELSNYQVGFEHQKNYISKCECTLAKRGAEIENLKNHIRKLTAMREAPYSPCQDNRCIQRSRSYSPEKIKERIATNRPKTHARGYRTPSEEEVSCCCWEFERLNGSKIFRQKLLLPNIQKM